MTPSQQRALDLATTHGGLVRLPGGFWTYTGCPTTERRDVGFVPDVWVGTTTIQALVRRGALTHTSPTTVRTR